MNRMGHDLGRVQCGQLTPEMEHWRTGEKDSCAMTLRRGSGRGDDITECLLDHPDAQATIAVGSRDLAVRALEWREHLSLRTAARGSIRHYDRHKTAANIVSKEKEPVAEAVPVGARPLDRRVGRWLAQLKSGTLSYCIPFSRLWPTHRRGFSLGDKLNQIMKPLCVIVSVASFLCASGAKANCVTIVEAIQRVRPGPLKVSKISEVAPVPFDEIVAGSELIVEGVVRPIRTFVSEDGCDLYTDYALSPMALRLPSAMATLLRSTRDT
jgi:hypothetical protein